MVLINSVAGLLFLSGTSVAITDVVVLAPDQETTIRKYVKKQPLVSVKLPGVELKVGSTVPGKVELHKVPNVKYEYTVTCSPFCPRL